MCGGLSISRIDFRQRHRPISNRSGHKYPCMPRLLEFFSRWLQRASPGLAQNKIWMRLASRRTTYMPLHCWDTGFSVLYDMTGSVGHGIFRTRAATSNHAANPPRPMTLRPLFPPSIRYPCSLWKFGKINRYCHPNLGSYAQSPFAERRFSRRSLTKSITHHILTESLPHLPRLPITTPNARVDVPIPPRFAYVPRSGATGSTRSPSHSETPPLF